MSNGAAEVGSTANRYQILAKLAVGGMAEIFLARGASVAGVERYCVLKRILPDRAADAQLVRMFVDEARLAAQLQHPNIASVYDIGVLGDSYFFTMEYVHGETVRALLQRAQAVQRPVPLACVLTIIAGAASGLHHAHERNANDGRPLGIVHRDVSPSNLMVSFEGNTKVVDFGVAKAADRAVETQSGTVKGKISYLSPEQCRGVRVDRRSDLFSLGIVMWELLTGARLYRRPSDFENMTAIVHEPPPPPSSRRPDIPRPIDDIVGKLLAKNLAERYQTADEVVEAIENASMRAGTILSASAVSRLMRDLFGVRGEPWLALAANTRAHEAATLMSRPVPADIGLETSDAAESELASVPDLSSLTMNIETDELSPVQLTDDVAPVTVPSPPPAMTAAMSTAAAASVTTEAMRRSGPIPQPAADPMRRSGPISHPAADPARRSGPIPQLAADPPRSGPIARPRTDGEASPGSTTVPAPIDARIAQATTVRFSHDVELAALPPVAPRAGSAMLVTIRSASSGPQAAPATRMSPAALLAGTPQEPAKPKAAANSTLLGVGGRPASSPPEYSTIFTPATRAASQFSPYPHAGAAIPLPPELPTSSDLIPLPDGFAQRPEKATARPLVVVIVAAAIIGVVVAWLSMRAPARAPRPSVAPAGAASAPSGVSGIAGASGSAGAAMAGSAAAAPPPVPAPATPPVPAPAATPLNAPATPPVPAPRAGAPDSTTHKAAAPAPADLPHAVATPAPPTSTATLNKVHVLFEAGNYAGALDVCGSTPATTSLAPLCLMSACAYHDLARAKRWFAASSTNPSTRRKLATSCKKTGDLDVGLAKLDCAANPTDCR